MTEKTTEVIVIGGGVIGLSIAWELAEQGVSVTILEKGQLGKEASWAGAGILPPTNLECADSTEKRLKAISQSLWPKWSVKLHEQTGIDNGFRNCGGLHLAENPSSNCTDAIHADNREIGSRSYLLEGERLREFEPKLHHQIHSAVHEPDVSQVRNPRHLKALQVACVKKGVRLLEGHAVTSFEMGGETVLGVKTGQGAFRAEKYCLAGGAWSGKILQTLGIDLQIKPIRGQIVLLSSTKMIFERVIQSGSRYLVPRSDGRVLIGSTEEDVGFYKDSTAEAVSELLEFGMSVVPALANTRLERTWSGLRPFTEKGTPFLERVSAYKNLFIAAGHFRAGLQMSPATAVSMRELMLGQELTIASRSAELM